MFSRVILGVVLLLTLTTAAAVAALSAAPRDDTLFTWRGGPSKAVLLAISTEREIHDGYIRAYVRCWHRSSDLNNSLIAGNMWYRRSTYDRRFGDGSSRVWLRGRFVSPTKFVGKLTTSKLCWGGKTYAVTARPCSKPALCQAPPTFPKPPRPPFTASLLVDNNEPLVSGSAYVSFEWDTRGGDGAETCAWDFGDGVRFNDPHCRGGIYHYYTRAGRFTVRFTATSYDGRTATATATVEIVEG